MNNEMQMNNIVKACTVKLISITGNFEHMWVNESLFPSKLFGDVDSIVSSTIHRRSMSWNIN